MKTKLLLLLTLLVSTFSWGQILTFDFVGIAGDEVAVNSNFNNSNLTSSTITRGSGLTASVNADRFNATGWATTSIDNAVSGNDYMEFTITPNSGYQFNVSSIVFQIQRSVTGLTSVALRSSVDGYATNLDVTKNIVDNTSTQTITFTFAQANSSSSVTYRLYGFAEATTGTGGPGDGTGNDILVNGSVTSSCTPPSNPTGTITVSANPSCGTATLSYPAGFYWQTTATGTSTSLPTSSNYSLASSGTIYVRAYDGVSCWSTNAISSGSVTVNSPVNVTAQPVNTSVVAGSNTSFSVTASNVATYQWQVDTSTGSGFVNLSDIAPYSNVTTSTLSITGATASMNNYQYRCVMTASSPCSTVNSNAATLMVTIPLAPVITSSLTKSTVYGNTDTYTITASNSPTSYSTGTLPSGFTLSGAVITKAASVDAGTYSITISATNAGGTDSKTLVCTVTKANPSFNPSSINLSIGGTQTITSSSTEGTLSFSSDNATIASVGTSSGIVTGVAAGITTINVSQAASTNYNAGTATVTVNVTDFSYSTGDVRPLFDYVDFSWSGTSPYYWEEYNGSTWSNRSSSPQAVKPTRIIVTKEGITGGANVTNTYNDIIITNGGSLILNNTSGTLQNFISATKKLEIQNGGTLTLNGQIQMASTSNLIVKEGGTFELNSSSINNAHSLWSGIEKFENGSTVVIKNWDWAASTTNMPLIRGAANQISRNSNNYVFGNLIIDTAVGATWTLISSSNYPLLEFCQNNLEIYNTSATNYITATSNDVSGFIIGGDFIIYDGWFNFGTTFTGSANFTNNYIINGNFITDSDDDLKLHYRVSGSGTADGTISVYGDFIVGENVTQITNQFNKKISLRSGTVTQPKVIDVAINGVLYVPFEIEDGYRLLKKDLYLGTNSSFLVKSNATLDFGFATDNITPLNIVRNGTQPGTLFTSEANSILKITSPDGIYELGSTPVNYTHGNVRTTTRNYNNAGVFHYIGKANQVTGTGLPATAANKHVIVELANDNLEFTSYNGIIRFNNPSTAIGSSFKGLEIRKGTVIADDAGNRFEDSATSGDVGNLKMSGGIYKIFTRDIQPAVSGNYDLSTGSKIIFGHTTATTTTQAIRGGDNYQYPEIEVTGRNVRYSNIGINMKSNGLFTVKENAVLTNTGNVGQIVSLDNSNPARLTIENNGTFKTEKEKGFSGAPDNINPAPSVRTGHTTGNVLVTLQPGSIVEYSRAGDQTITHTNFSATSTPYSYQNLHISGSGNKTLQHNTATRVNENLEVLAGNTATLLIEEGKVITVKEAVKVPNSGDAKLEIKDNGQLIQIDDTNPLNLNSGENFYMERKADVTTNDYVYWSSPTDNYSVTLIPNSSLRYEWNPIKYNSNGTQGNWIAASSTMAKGKGYIVRVPPSATPSEITTNFKGTPRNGTVTVDIFRGNRLVDGTNVTRFDDNWNLVGNPYPSAISALEFLQTNGANLVDTDPSTPTPTVPATTIVGAVWIWKHGIDLSSGNQDPFYYNFANNYSSTDYIKFNGTGSTDPSFNGFIGAGQGFMISMKDNPGVNPNDDDEVLPTTLSGIYKPYKNTVVFTNSMRFDDSEVHYNNNQFFRTANAENSVAASDEKHRIWLDIIKTSNGQTDTALIGYVSNATMGEDNLYDTFFMPRNEVSLYSLINTKSYIIQGRSLPFDTTDLVPLGMKIISAGSHTIAIRQVDGIFEGNQNIYLEDKQLNIIHDLKQSPYHFTAPTGINNTRFVLRYTTNALGNADFDYDNQVIVFSKNNTVTINSSIQNIDEVQVYDVLGRQLYQNTAVENQEHSFAKDIAQQTVIVKVKLQNGIWVTKKVLVK